MQRPPRSERNDLTHTFLREYKWSVLVLCSVALAVGFALGTLYYRWINSSGTRTNPKHGCGSIQRHEAAETEPDSQVTLARKIQRKSTSKDQDDAMKHTNNIPRIQGVFFRFHLNGNRNCEEPVKGQARSRGSLRSPLTEPSQFQSTPPLWKRKKKIEMAVPQFPPKTEKKS